MRERVVQGHLMYVYGCTRDPDRDRNTTRCLLRELYWEGGKSRLSFSVVNDSGKWLNRKDEAKQQRQSFSRGF